ncbi:peptide deformylase [Bacillus horti]|uniref:Peptide deformylase n=1 Tax=Caldalkalibacillus horti TaxID=77523 RepID=A0ABT9VXI1_9BACI|nr:peptide deformylase [Bacillus horti]MDQ0165698.1 peptide deformylase [Bacillus horti]
MGVRVIVKNPDPILREKTIEVKNFNANLHKLLDDMAETMYQADGVGLAAPQVGISKRVAVIDAGSEHGLIELVNPVIVSKSGEQLGPEGCLSFPGLVGDVRRAQTCKVEAFDRHGEKFEVEGEDLLARALQHEIDHLNGVLFVDFVERYYESESEDEAGK